MRHVTVSSVCDFFQTTLKAHPSLREQLAEKYASLASVTLAELQISALGQVKPETHLKKKAKALFHEIQDWVHAQTGK